MKSRGVNGGERKKVEEVKESGIGRESRSMEEEQWLGGEEKNELRTAERKERREQRKAEESKGERRGAEES